MTFRQIHCTLLLYVLYKNVFKVAQIHVKTTVLIVYVVPLHIQ